MSQPEGTTASENEDKTSEETSETGTEQDHNVKTESSENYELSSTSVSSQEVSTENSTNAMNKKHPEKQIGKENLYHSDYRFSLRLRVHYRINEEAIRCLLLVRWVLEQR